MTLLRVALATIALGACSPYDDLPTCTDGAWTTRTLRQDGAWSVEARTRATCDGFPDEVTEYEITARRPGREIVLRTGSVETTDLDFAGWIAGCRPRGDGFSC